MITAFCFLVLLSTGSQAERDNTLDELRAQIDFIESRSQAETTNAEELAQLRQRLDPIYDAVRQIGQELEPRFKEIQARQQQLLPTADEKNTTPETAEVKAERERLAAEQADLDARIRTARLFETRINQINDRIGDRRRQLFTAQLLEQTPSPLSLLFWTEAWSGLIQYWTSMRTLGADWLSFHKNTLSWQKLSFAALATAFLCLIVFFVLKAFRRNRLVIDAAQGQSSKVRRLIFALRILFERAMTVPVVIAALALVLFGFDLVLPHARPLVMAIIFASLVIALTRGILDSVLAPGIGARRLVSLNDETAYDFYRAGRNASLIYAVGLVIFGLHRVLIAPVSVVALTTLILSLALVGIVLIYLYRTDPEDNDEEEDKTRSVEGRGFGWTRPALWIVAGAVIAAALSGYVALAAFIATRLSILVFVWVATVLVLKIIDAIGEMVFSASSARARRVSAIIGVRPDRLELIGAILVGLSRFVVIMAALVLVMGPWGFAGEGGNAIDLSFLGLRFGDLRGLLMAIAGALAILAIGLVILRRITHWMNTDILPRTELDPGLSNSISTVIGYAGIALVGLMAVRQIGIDFSNLSMVAGALSVGIGFGLQSIVQNFVSGLIVLAERPIRVDDTIVVKGEEGRVRRISVRSTEIETLDRTTVIVPNSDLITGVVKNLSHPDNRGRIVIPMLIGYKSSLEEAIKLLLEIAKEQPFVKENPAPSVFVRGFVASGIDLELRVIVSDISQALGVRSNLHIAIMERFAEAGIALHPPSETVQTVITAEQPVHTGIDPAKDEDKIR